MISKEEKLAFLLNLRTSEIVNMVKSDITFLSRQVELFYLYERSDFERHLEETFFQYSVAKKLYDQIRFIDMNGMETVRINYDGKNVSTVPGNKLQDKCGRYYYKDILNFSRDSIYFSVLDLNIENKMIEIPYKPMIRVGALVFDPDGNKIGMVIVNYLANAIIEELKSESRYALGHTLFLNRNGYYFIGTNPEDEWGFMFEDKKEKTFFNDFKEESKIVYSNDHGTFTSPKGLFFYSTIVPQSKNMSHLNSDVFSDRFWKIVSFIPQQQIIDSVYDILRPWLKISFIFSVAIIFLFWLLARNIQLKRLVTLEIQLKNKDLSEMNATKDKFFSIIAHDLRSPLSGLLGLSRLLNEDIEDHSLSREDINSMVSMMYQTSKNTYELLENLLDWARMQTDKLNANPRSLELSSCLANLETMMSELAQKKGINLEIATSSDIKVFADKEMIATVLRNLVSNALKFTPRGGTVSVTPEVKPDVVEIAVTDTGVGIASEEINNLFRIDKVKSRRGTENEQGTGLGLLLCKEFVEKNNGSIWVTSKIGEGSTFFISLPLAKDA